MKKLYFLCLFLTLIITIAGPIPVAFGAPSVKTMLQIKSIEIDYDTCELLIMGENFGDDTPTVQLHEQELIVIESSPNQIIAEFDCSMGSGAYRLSVTQKQSTKKNDIMSLSISKPGPGLDPTRLYRNNAILSNVWHVNCDPGDPVINCSVDCDPPDTLSSIYEVNWSVDEDGIITKGCVGKCSYSAEGETQIKEPAFIEAKCYNMNP